MTLLAEPEPATLLLDGSTWVRNGSEPSLFRTRNVSPLGTGMRFSSPRLRYRQKDQAGQLPLSLPSRMRSPIVTGLMWSG